MNTQHIIKQTSLINRALPPNSAWLWAVPTSAGGESYSWDCRAHSHSKLTPQRCCPPWRLWGTSPPSSLTPSAPRRPLSSCRLRLRWGFWSCPVPAAMCSLPDVGTVRFLRLTGSPFWWTGARTLRLVSGSWYDTWTASMQFFWPTLGLKTSRGSIPSCRGKWPSRSWNLRSKVRHKMVVWACLYT